VRQKNRKLCSQSWFTTQVVSLSTIAEVAKTRITFTYTTNNGFKKTNMMTFALTNNTGITKEKACMHALEIIQVVVRNSSPY
jgi:hypothetical protein